MRSWLVAFTIVLGGVAHASFDLMLLPDQATGRILRFDPINQVQLGSLNVHSAPKAVAAKSGSPYAYSTNNQGGVKFDYSTGERLTAVTFPDGPISLNHDGSRVFETIGSSLVYRYDANLGYLGNFTAGPITNTMALQQYGSARIIALGLNSSGDLVAANFDTTTFAQVGPTIMLVAAANYLAGSFVNGMSFVNGSGMLAYRASDSSTKLLRVNLDANMGASSTTAGATVSGYATATNSTATVLAGHTGFFVVGTNNSGTGTYISEFVNPSGGVSSVYTLNGVLMPAGRWRGANIVAPEPGTMIALGAGVLALFRRRKKAA